MRKKRILFFFLMLLIVGIGKVSAEELTDDGFGPINLDYQEETKYFKTVTMLSDLELMSLDEGNLHVVTTEITEEEFNYLAEHSDSINGTAYTYTSTMKLTIKLEPNGSNYKYTGIAEWSVMPSTSNRSYDTIGIGHYASVTVFGSPDFEQYYCVSGSGCYTQTVGWHLHTSTGGSAATYALPTGTLTVLKQTFSFVVKKTDSSSTLSIQRAVSSYGHANTNVSYTDAKDFTISTLGLIYDAAYSSYTVTNVGVGWSGTW